MSDTTTISLPTALRDDLKDEKPDDMPMYEFLRQLLENGEVYAVDAERVLEGLEEFGLEPVDSDDRQVFVALDQLQEDVGALADRLATLETNIQKLRQ